MPSLVHFFLPTSLLTMGLFTRSRRAFSVLWSFLCSCKERREVSQSSQRLCAHILVGGARESGEREGEKEGRREGERERREGRELEGGEGEEREGGGIERELGKRES